jgi:cysteine desulfurase family protein
MTYLDNGATSFHKPASVRRAMLCALENCANPGRGGYPAAQSAARTVYRCRERAANMFDCSPEQVAFTSNCTHGLNIAINTLVSSGDPVVITGFEHNAVLRPLIARKAQITVAGTKLFNHQDTLERFEDALKHGAKVAVFTHCSNVFGYILPIEKMAALCKQYCVPFIVDAAQSAGSLPVRLRELGAAFIAMPGHKGLLGPQGTGLLLCGELPKPLIYGGTGSNSADPNMPDFLPDRLEAGTLNVPGIAGLEAGLRYVEKVGTDRIFLREKTAAENCSKGLEKLGYSVFYGKNQGGTVSFIGKRDCEEIAEKLGKRGVAVRAGLHCAPLAHESAGTLKTGTVRVSFGHDATQEQMRRFLRVMEEI